MGAPSSPLNGGTVPCRIVMTYLPVCSPLLTPQPPAMSSVRPGLGPTYIFIPSVSYRVWCVEEAQVSVYWTKWNRAHNAIYGALHPACKEGRSKGQGRFHRASDIRTGFWNTINYKRWTKSYRGIWLDCFTEVKKLHLVFFSNNDDHMSVGFMKTGILPVTQRSVPHDQNSDHSRVCMYSICSIIWTHMRNSWG